MERRPTGLLDLPAYEGAIRVALSYADRTKKAAGRLGRPSDIEALHDFRVGLRRLRSNLQAYGPYLATAVSPKRRKQIRELAASTNACRDAEVQLAWLEARQLDATIEDGPGVEWLRRELERRFDLEQERILAEAPERFRKVEKRLRRRLDDLRTTGRVSGLDEGLHFSTALERRVAEYATELDVHLSRVHTVADEAEAHRARIRAKRLRYLLEPIAADLDGVVERLEELKQLQDLLGDLRDAQLLTTLVSGLERGSDSTGSATPPPEAKAGLRTVLGWLETERSALFSRLRESWLGDSSAPFFAAVEELRGSLVTEGSGDVEIERKYLLSSLPPGLADRPYREIDQGYLPGERLQERVRRVRMDGSEWYVRTVKVGRGIRRIELQEDADAETFEVLWPLTLGRRVTKRRYVVSGDGATWEIDEFMDRELVLAEVELSSEDARPPIPGWLAPHVVREVTGEAEYLNVNLAR